MDIVFSSFFRHFRVDENSPNLDLEPCLGQFGTSRKRGVLPSRAALDLLLYMVRSILFRGVGCPNLGVKNRKSQNFTMIIEMDISTVAESKYLHAMVPCERFMKMEFFLRNLNFLIVFVHFKDETVQTGACRFDFRPYYNVPLVLRSLAPTC